jgi:preprotein translocase subunit SecD
VGAPVQIPALNVAASFALVVFAGEAEANDLLTLKVAESTRGSQALTHSPTLDVRLNDDSRQLFAQWTHRHVGEVIEFLIDGQVVMRPRLQTPITGGVLQIAGPASEKIDEIAPKLVDGSSVLVVDTAN